MHSTATMVRVPGTSFANGLLAGMQALRGTFFRPNTVFLRLGTSGPGSHLDDIEICQIVQEAERQRVGTLLWVPHPVSSLGQRRRINVWIRDRSPDWSIGWDIGNLDLMLLVALKLQANWDARLRLVMVVQDDADVGPARDFLDDLVRLARLHDAEVVVGSGDFRSFIDEAPPDDVSIFGLAEDPDVDGLHAIVRATGSSCLFVRDSGNESALA